MATVTSFHMHYSSANIAYAQTAIQRNPSPHLLKLLQMLKKGAPYSDLLAYGQAFLPQLRNLETGKADLDLLRNYRPEIVGYFDTLSELPSLPQALREVATELAIFANGESIQTDEHYLKFDAEAEIKKALGKVPELE